MSTSTKVIFIIGILLLIYGYVCRFLNIYFFWDSKYFGWIGIISGVLLLLIDIRMMRLRQRQNIFFVRAFVAVIVVFLALEASAIVWLKSSTVYNEVTTLIERDEVMKAEFGDIHGFNLIPGIDIIDILNFPSSESLVFVITVRGQNAYKELEVKIARLTVTGWSIVSTRWK